MHERTILDEFTRQAESFNTAAVANAPETLAELVRFAAPRPDERWVEAACGPGLIARALAPLTRTVVGFDTTPAMIALARREAAGLTNLAFAMGDATALDAADGDFDGAVTRFSLHHIPVPSRVVAELARVVRPGGTIASLDFAVPRGGWYPAWWAWTRIGLPSAGRVAGDGWYETGRFLAGSIEGFWREHPLEAVLAMWDGAGIGSLRVRVLSRGGGVIIRGIRR